MLVNFDEAFIHPDWGLFKDVAEEIHIRYKYDMTKILQDYGLEKESEALSGCINKMTKLTQQNEAYDAKLLLRLRIKRLYKSTRHSFFKKFSGEDIACSTKRKENIMAKASALYRVTYSQEVPVFLSCPWVFADILAELAKRSLAVSGPLQRLSVEARTYTEHITETLSLNSTTGPIRETKGVQLITDYLNKNPWM